MTRAATARAPAAVDLDLVASQIHVVLTDLRGSEAEAKRNEELVERHATVAESARSTAQRRRIEIGGLLLQARPTWPERGTGKVGVTVAGKYIERWGEFLALVAIDDATARRYMAEASDPAAFAHGKAKGEPGRLESIRAEIRKLGREDRKLLLAELKPAAVSGGSGETDRGAWCTLEKWCTRVGEWDIDPFSNPRSKLIASVRCMLENGGDGLADLEVPGSWRSGAEQTGVADENTRVWIQPPYDIVEDVIAHYGHTRFCALLRLDSSTEWFRKLWDLTQVIALARGTREFFEAAPGVEASGNPQPHAFYFRDPRDVTPAIAESCILLDRYEAGRLPALHIVR